MLDIRLRPSVVNDEAAVRQAQLNMAGDNFDFAPGLDADADWPTFMRDRAAEHDGRVQAGRVPASFLVAVVDGQLVGRTSVRFRLNEYLHAKGGHVGYCVLRPFRRRGFATEILRQSVTIARAHGVDSVLVTCDDDNVGSAAVIEHVGGRLDPAWPLTTDTPPKRRYRIE